MVEAANGDVKKALVTLAIEQSLIEFSDTILEVVQNRLKRDCDAYLPDCYEHPEYLIAILKELFGESHKTILNSIQKHLDEFSHQEPIQEFLLKIKQT